MYYTLNQLRAMRDQILYLAQKHGASNIRVFGSVARGDATDQSDVDLLVAFNDQTSLLDRAGLLIELQELLNCRVDVISDRAIKPYLSPYILKDAVPL
jgi:predicted nucleotidyltransferase